MILDGKSELLEQRPMPAVRSAAGPISVPACEAPISMGTPSKAMRGLLMSGSGMRRGLSRTERRRRS